VQNLFNLDDLGRTLGATPAQIALAWLLDLSPNVLLIPATWTRQHLYENIRSGSLRIDDTIEPNWRANSPLLSRGSGDVPPGSVGGVDYCSWKQVMLAA